MRRIGVAVSFMFASIAMATDLSEATMSLILQIANDDANALIATGTVCEGMGVKPTKNQTKCGITGIRTEGNESFWTTRCFTLCNDGNFEEGNFCKFPVKDNLKAGDEYCDR